jgi:hypothetical protein
MGGREGEEVKKREGEERKKRGEKKMEQKRSRQIEILLEWKKEIRFINIYPNFFLAVDRSGFPLFIEYTEHSPPISNPQVLGCCSHSLI